MKLSEQVMSIIGRHIDPSKKFDAQFALCEREIVAYGCHLQFTGENANVFWQVVVSVFGDLTAEKLAQRIEARNKLRDMYAAKNPQGLDQLDNIITVQRPYGVLAV